jgi:integrase
MRKRRLEVSQATIRGNLYGVADLFDWGFSHFSRSDLEEFLNDAGQLSPSALDSLCTFVRERKYEKSGEMVYRSMQTAAHRIYSIEIFLSWAADPIGRGRRTKDDPVSPEELKAYRTRLEASFKSLRKAPGRSRRPAPLTQDQDELLREIMSPLGPAKGGAPSFDRFPNKNPFQASTQLRNWLFYALLRYSGLRRGEALKLKTADIDTTGDPEARIRRRPNDPDDSRVPAPRVKGAEGVVPLSQRVANGIKAYTTNFRLPGYRRKGTTYLFTTRRGTPLSTSYASRIFRILRSRFSELAGVTPHALRHTWAEELAAYLFSEKDGDSEEVLSLLREAGRWRPGSHMPNHYIQNVVQRKTNKNIRDRNERLIK